MNDAQRWQLIEPIVTDILDDMTNGIDHLMTAAPSELPAIRNALFARNVTRIAAASYLAECGQ